MLVLAGNAQAAPSIIISQNIKADCYDASPYACFLPSTETIYISATAAPVAIPFLFLHEYGHYLTQDVPDAQLRAMFGGASNYEAEETAANAFYTYVEIPYGMPANQKEFFTNLLKRDNQLIK